MKNFIILHFFSFFFFFHYVWTSTRCFPRTPLICEFENYEIPEPDPLPKTIDSIIKRASIEANVEKKEKMLTYAIESARFSYQKFPSPYYYYAKFLENDKNDLLLAYPNYLKAYYFGNQAAFEDVERTLISMKTSETKIFEEIDALKYKYILKANELKFDSALSNLENERITDFVYHTNAIEGSTLTKEEVDYIRIKGRAPFSSSSIQEMLEARAGFDGVKLVKAIRKSNVKSIKESDIQKIHKEIFKFTDINEAGTYRKQSVFVGDYAPPHYSFVPKLMKSFEDWLTSSEFLLLHPIEQAALAHFQLAYIHPFIDGNGRTSRLLMNLILSINDYPFIVIKQQNRGEYFTKLHDCHMKEGGDTRGFIHYISEIVKTTLNELIEQMNKLQFKEEL